jgi:hypothetical protein
MEPSLQRFHGMGYITSLEYIIKVWYKLQEGTLRNLVVTMRRSNIVQPEA